MAVYSSSGESSSETDSEHAENTAHNAVFSSGCAVNSLQPVERNVSSGDEEHQSLATEGTALPRPAWMDASSQDSSIADARVQSIRDIIRVSYGILSALSTCLKFSEFDAASATEVKLI